MTTLVQGWDRRAWQALLVRAALVWVALVAAGWLAVLAASAAAAVALSLALAGPALTPSWRWW